MGLRNFSNPAGFASSSDDDLNLLGYFSTFASFFTCGETCVVLFSYLSYLYFLNSFWISLLSSNLKSAFPYCHLSFCLFLPCRNSAFQSLFWLLPPPPFRLFFWFSIEISWSMLWLRCMKWMSGRRRDCEGGSCGVAASCESCLILITWPASSVIECVFNRFLD